MITLEKLMSSVALFSSGPPAPTALKVGSIHSLRSRLERDGNFTSAEGGSFSEFGGIPVEVNKYLPPDKAVLMSGDEVLCIIDFGE